MIDAQYLMRLKHLHLDFGLAVKKVTLPALWFFQLKQQLVISQGAVVTYCDMNTEKFLIVKMNVCGLEVIQGNEDQKTVVLEFTPLNP